LCGKLTFISITIAWSFFGIKPFATVEANDCLLLLVLVEVSGKLSIGNFVEVYCSCGLISDVVLDDIFLAMVFDVLVDFQFCTLLICTGLRIKGLFKAVGFEVCILVMGLASAGFIVY
jgi:hypothetical protein